VAEPQLGERVKGIQLLFLPDGSGGYFANPFHLGAFRRDPATRTLTWTGVVEQTERQVPDVLAFDPANGWLYAASQGWDKNAVSKLSWRGRN
jgi:hypothetical protein